MDRLLKKYLKNAPLSHIYKLVRKDVKVNGKRCAPETILADGDEVVIYISPEDEFAFTEKKELPKAKKQFRIAYEDDYLLIVEKPFGLLTHGDAAEKKNTLANQVAGYLQESGAYMPGKERIFSPAPVNRLDRNTTGLVIFGKNNPALQSLNAMIREKGCVRKYYLTIVSGAMKEAFILKGKLEKDERTNKVTIRKASDEHSDHGKSIETIARPIKTAKGFTLVEVELVTGRTHQIRAHLADAGFPVIGDIKYGIKGTNQKIAKQFGLTSQLLHASRLCFDRGLLPLEYLAGKEIKASIPQEFERIKGAIFD